MALITNPIKYTSRTFQSILSDINTDQELATKPNWWKRLWAGIGDVFSIWLNAVANLAFLRTAYTRSAVADLSELIDYSLSPQRTSSGRELFYVATDLGPAIFPFAVLKVNLVAKSQGTISVTSKTFESRTDENFTLVQSFITAIPATDILTISVDLVYTGHKVRFTTTGALPAPLQVNTDYYAIYVDATSIRLSSTLADALAGNYIDLTDVGSGVNQMTVYSKAVDVYQQESKTDPVSIGTSDGISEWQEFDLPDRMVLVETVAIVINAVTWTRVDSFIDSSPTDTHYKFLPKSDGTFFIRFGNGVYGVIPPAFDIEATYALGGGRNSNIPVLNRVSIYAGGDANLNEASNVTMLSGGVDEETLVNAKRTAPLLLKARDRFITREDGVALVLNYGGIAQTEIIENYYGTLSCKVVGVAYGGGNPSPALRAAIQQFLIDRTILESITVVFDTATITTGNVVAFVKILPGYAYSSIEPFLELAFWLFITETGQEIKTDFESNGIESAILLINNYFGSSFLPADYTKIQRLLEALTPRSFGDSIQLSDVYAFVQPNVEGVDYVNLTTFGTGLPMNLADDEITTDGTITLSEIP